MGKIVDLHQQENRQSEPDLKAALQVFDAVCAECDKHKGQYFDMDCPYCGAKKAFFVHNTYIEANGTCSVCEKPFHILWNKDNQA